MRRPLHILRHTPHELSRWLLTTAVQQFTSTQTARDGEGASGTMDEDDRATVGSTVEEDSENGGGGISKDHDKVILNTGESLVAASTHHFRCV